MRTLKSILPAAILLMALALPAIGQGSFDVYGGARTVVVSAPATLVGAAAGPVTNTAIDIHNFIGIAKLDFFGETNSAGTLTVTVQTSSDQSTWSALANYALSTPTTVIVTNLALGTNATATVTNSYLMPGTITTPTVGTAGFAGAYLTPAQFTNSGAVTMPGDRVVSIGFVANDASRYIRTIWTPGGSTTNCSTAAILTGKHRSSSVVP